MCIAFLVVNVPHQNGTFVKNDVTLLESYLEVWKFTQVSLFLFQTPDCLHYIIVASEISLQCF